MGSNLDFQSYNHPLDALAGLPRNRSSSLFRPAEGGLVRADAGRLSVDAGFNHAVTGAGCGGDSTCTPGDAELGRAFTARGVVGRTRADAGRDGGDGACHGGGRGAAPKDASQASNSGRSVGMGGLGVNSTTGLVRSGGADFISYFSLLT